MTNWLELHVLSILVDFVPMRQGKVVYKRDLLSPLRACAPSSSIEYIRLDRASLDEKVTICGWGWEDFSYIGLFLEDD